MTEIIIPKEWEGRKWSLVMVSGGLDSVAALVWMLENTDDLIHVHHIRIQGSAENREIPELAAFLQCHAYIAKHYRKIEKTTHSTVTWPGPHVPYDMFSYMFQAAGIMDLRKGPFRFSRIVTGSIDESADPARIAEIEERRERAWNMFTSIHRPHPTLGQPEWFKPLVNMKKPEVAALLPDELRNMTFSCRFPIYSEDGLSYEKCGKCRPCINRSSEDD